MTDINDPLDAAVLLKTSVRNNPHGGHYASWDSRTDVILCNRMDPDALWSVGHEVGHATGGTARLGRRAQQFYLRELNKNALTRLFGYHQNRTCVRTEEAICDLVALALTGKTRGTLVNPRDSYPPVTPGTRADRYVQYHAQKAIEYLTKQLQQEAA
jgi:hypothetical protein